MSAVDWAAIATAAVGIAGVAATYFQSKVARKAASDDLKKSLEATTGNLATSIHAEDRRVLQAEKQRVYSEFQGSLDDVFVAALNLIDRVTGKADLNSALTIMYRATAAVKLVAPERLGELAAATAQAVADETGTARAGTDAFDRDNKIYKNRQELYRLMREDLGVDTSHVYHRDYAEVGGRRGCCRTNPAGRAAAEEVPSRHCRQRHGQQAACKRRETLPCSGLLQQGRRPEVAQEGKLERVGHTYEAVVAILHRFRHDYGPGDRRGGYDYD